MELSGEAPVVVVVGGGGRKKKRKPYKVLLSPCGASAHQKCHKIKIFTDKVLACLFHSTIKELISNFTLSLCYAICIDLS